MPDCAQCLAGPSGVAGHERLVMEGLPGVHHGLPRRAAPFKCLACGAWWARCLSPADVQWRRVESPPKFPDWACL